MKICTKPVQPGIHLLRSVVDAGDAAILVVNHTLHPLFFNQLFGSIFHVNEANDLAEKDLNSLFGVYPAERTRSFNNRLIVETLHSVVAEIKESNSDSPVKFSTLYYGDRTLSGHIAALPEGYLFSFRDVTEKRRYDKALLHLAAGVGSQTDDLFFDILATQLGEAVSAEHVVFRIFDKPGQLKVVGRYSLGEGGLAKQTAVSGTPCEQVLENGTLVVRKEVCKKFPVCETCFQGRVESFVGAQICDPRGEILGCVAAFFTRELHDSNQLEMLLSTFAIRASVELERLRNKIELKESRAKQEELGNNFRTVLDGISDSIIRFDAKTMTVLWANQRAHQGTLVPEGESLIGKSCREIICGEDQCNECHGFACRHGEDFKDGKRRAKNGQIWGEKYFPLKDGGDEIESIIRVASNITTKEKLRLEGVQSSRLSALGELADGVAHAINNPVGAILMYTPVLEEMTEQLLRHLDENDPAKHSSTRPEIPNKILRSGMPKILEDIQKSAERVKQTVDGIMEISLAGTCEELNREIVDPNEFLTATMERLNRDISAATEHYNLSLAPAPPKVMIDPRKLEQALGCLIRNACQALPDKDRELNVSTLHLAEDDAVAIIIEDMGVGISKENLANITSPFFTTKREQGAVGLGLSIASRIITAHDSTLEFSSIEGKGTTVLFKLSTEKQLR